ncbi:MAG: hypothetical protein CFE24_13550 [Flavobacterium sp. BFFFF2]|nr:MAG: hypothetical protein CFE24_13550 [Flavobacterium sp. BFFFF2]
MYVGTTLVVARYQGCKIHFYPLLLEQFVHCLNIVLHKKFWIENDYFLLKDICSFSLLAQG